MADVVNRETRSRMMSGIRGRNTRPEVFVRSLLRRLRIRFSGHVRELDGVPDFVLYGRRAVVFVHGCFWHAHSCRYFKLPGTRRRWWTAKLRSNIARDRRNVSDLLQDEWRVAIIWECAVKASLRGTADALEQQLGRWVLDPRTPYIEFRGVSDRGISGRRTTARAL